MDDLTQPSVAETDPMVPLLVRALEALERKDYALAAGLAIMAATFLSTRGLRAGRIVPREYLATILLGAAIAGGIATALAGGRPPVATALALLMCAASAIACWEGVAKHAVRWWTWRRRRPVFTRKFPMA